MKTEVGSILPPIHKAASLFHSQDYCNLHKNESSVIIATNDGYLTGFSANSVLYSPQNAPFGGPITTKNPVKFFSDVADFCKGRQLNSLSVRHAPEAYKLPYISPDINHFRKTDTVIDLNYHLEITETSFINLIHENQRSNINKCRDLGYYCTKVSLKRAHSFITKALKERNIPMTISWDQLDVAAAQLPDTYNAYAVLHEQSIIAAAITVNVTKSVCYLAYNAHDKSHNNSSPLVFLYDHLYGELRDLDFKIFDLGVCSVNGVINKGLQKFKERMGGIASNKNTISYQVL